MAIRHPGTGKVTGGSGMSEQEILKRIRFVSKWIMRISVLLWIVSFGLIVKFHLALARR